MVHVLYFARLREQVGMPGEIVVANAALASVRDLRAWLCRRGVRWAEALGDDRRALVAVNREMAGPDTPVRDGDEVAFFPPVTGG